jgi:hypothetical protein
MARYAQLSGGVVHYVIDSETDPDGINGEWIACGNAGPGWTYDGSNFAAPVIPPAPTVPWTKKEFLLKFTPAEYAAIKAATLVDATLDYYWSLFTVAQDVVKTDPVTIAGINALEAAGLLAVGRAAEILA